MGDFLNNIKNSFTNIFGYKNESLYNFTIPDVPNIAVSDKQDSTQKIFTNLKENAEFMKIRYNSMINSDIAMREFTLNARGKQFSAFIFYIDGMVDQTLVNSFVLKPLMLKNMSNNYEGEQSRVIEEYNSKNIRIKKVRKFNIVNYIDECLIPQNSVKKVSMFSEIISRHKRWKLCPICRHYACSI